VNTPALLPCPFCGKSGRMAFDRDGESCRVICANWCADDDCCLGSGPWKDTQAEAIEAWNRRTAQPAEGVPTNCDETDQLLRDLRLDPARFRSEGGWLNPGKIRAAILDPEGYDGLYLSPDWPADCQWPASPFTVKDMPGEHEPCYLVMPDGGMVAFVHHATNGVDQARAKFIAAACNGRPTDDAMWDHTLRERDRYHETADDLANAIADYFDWEIGEHSSANCPWENALELLAAAPPAAARSGEQNGR